MKANELMIGDLILQGRVNGVCTDNVFVEGRVGCIYDESLNKPSGNVSDDRIEPITLTKEILKANGFPDNGEFPRKDHIKINYKDGWFISFCECYGLEIKYVHELQHLLRLCGLTELANNFKLD